MMLSLRRALGELTAKNHRVLFFLLSVTLAAYGTILFGGFVFDDNIFIQNNAQIRSLANIDTLYNSSTTAGSGLAGDNFYRPNQQLIYALLYALFGLLPFFFHLVPLLFHALNGFLIFILFHKLGLRRATALAGSLLFLLHPILTEAVSYISGLSDPLVTSTILLTLLIFRACLRDTSARQLGRHTLLGAAVFSFGLFSKENQIVSLGLMAALAVFEYKRGRLARWFPAIVFIGILSILAACYVYARLTMLDFTGTVGLTPEINEYTQHITVRMATFVHILPQYFKMMIFPWRLNYEKPYAVARSLANIPSALGILFLLSAGTLIITAIVKKTSGIILPIALGASWFLVSLLPVSGIIPVNAMYLEHWLYLPIIGIILCFCFLSEQFPDTKRELAFYPFLAVLLLFVVRIIMRNTEWGDPLRFYANELRYTQSSARIYTDMGMEEAARGMCDAAIPHYQKAISLNDIYPQTHHNLAKCLEHLGQIQDAANEYLRALLLQPDFLYSIDGMAHLLFVAGDKRASQFLDLKAKAENGQTLTQKDIVAAAHPEP